MQDLGGIKVVLPKEVKGSFVIDDTLFWFSYEDDVNTLQIPKDYFVVAIEKDTRNLILDASAESLSKEMNGFFVAAMPHNQSTRSIQNIKKIEVAKPWGAESWLFYHPKVFCVKNIIILRGFKTSLQFHEFKYECNYLRSGKLRLYYNRESSPKSSAIDIQYKDFSAPAIFRIKPGTIHRMEALTDVEFLEVSTPEVDDVIRIEDDTGRSNGRILAEHSAE